MRFALFPGDEHYHLVKSDGYRTFCGVPTIMRPKESAEYRPPARVTAEHPTPAALYKPCPRCEEKRTPKRSRG